MYKSQIVIAKGAGIFIRTFSDITDAVGLCLCSRGLIVSEQEMTPEFFDLKTGLAGEMFQKFINYKIRLAIILPDPTRYGDRIGELAYEHRSHNAIRFVDTLDAAVSWLSTE